jgi:BolA protein
MNASEVNQTRIEQIRAALEAALSTDSLEITDESHLHAGHAGARSGKGHFHVKIVASEFAGLALVKRHRLVYNAVGELMDREIHALGIEAIAPSDQID